MKELGKPLDRPAVSIEVVTADDVAGLCIRAGFADAPFGTCFVADCGRGIVRLSFPQGGEVRTLMNETVTRWPAAEILRDDAHATAVAGRVFLRRRFRPGGEHLLVQGTAFQIEVWQSLLKIPLGELVHYGDIAARIGRPAARRAVGGAVGANPVAWLIPCHRVIPASGGIGKFRWGSACKQAMINAEESMSGNTRNTRI